MVVRFGPSDDENLRGWLMRLGTWNAFRQNATFMRVSVTYEASPAEGIRFLRSMTDCPTARIERLFGDNRRWAPVPGQVVSRYEVDSTGRICPDCVRCHGRILADWSLGPCVGCDVHGRMLVDACQRCGEKLSWTRRRIDRCPCGFDLLGSPVVPMSEDLAGLVRMLRLACNPARPFHASPKHPQELCGADLAWLVNLIGRDLLREGGGRDAGPALPSRATAMAAAPLLKDWPGPMRRYLHRILVQDAPGALSGRGLLVMLNRAGHERPKARAMLLAECGKVVHGKRFARLGRNAFEVGDVDGRRYVSHTEASRIVGLRDSHLFDQARRHSVLLQPVRKGRYETELYELEGIRKAAQERRLAIGNRSLGLRQAQAAAELGVGRGSVPEMAAAGLVGTWREDGCTYYSKEDVRSVLRRLEKLASTRVGGPGDRRLSECAQGTRWVSVPMLLVEVLEGRIPVATHVGPVPSRQVSRQPRGVNGFLLDDRAFRAFARSVATHLTAEQVAKETMVPLDIVPAIVAMGLLSIDPETVVGSQRRPGITSASVETFRGRYVHSADLRVVKPGIALSQIEAMGLRAVVVVNRLFRLYDRVSAERVFGPLPRSLGKA